MIFHRVRFTHQNSTICHKLRLHQHSHVVRKTHPTKPNWRILQKTLQDFLCTSVASLRCTGSLWLNLYPAVKQ
jgi:hypothetical protein